MTLRTLSCENEKFWLSLMSSNADSQKTMHEVFVDQINEALDDIDVIEDFRVKDVESNPELVDLVIRGRLKSDLGRKKPVRKELKEDPVSDYDRAMKGVS